MKPALTIETKSGIEVYLDYEGRIYLVKLIITHGKKLAFELYVN